MPVSRERETLMVQAERAVLAAVRLPDANYDPANPFGELRSLAEQAGAIVVGELEQRKPKPEPATFIGTGKLEELKAMCDELDAGVVIFDHDLSPRHIRNIEEVLTPKAKEGEPPPKARKVVDRSELILDVFAARATTHEAKLAVELAQLEYTYPRLRAMWDHLERIVGAGGGGVGVAGIGTRGPGEQQLEIDRRLVQRRVLDLKRDLAEVHARKQRMVRDRRKDHFTVCIVGYTNAGKSTLFNSLTAGGAYADDRLFATLVTRTRDWDLGGGLAVLLSDTVGFVRDLPHHLIASFRATLEEATHADLLLVVLDAADPAAELQYQTVMQTLDSIEAEVAEAEGTDSKGEREGWKPPERLLLLNKTDRLTDNRSLLVWQAKVPGAIAISALSPGGPGHEELRRRVLQAAQMGITEVEVVASMADGRTLQRLENRAQVLSREYEEARDGVPARVRMRVRIGRRQLDQLRSGAAWLQVRELAPSP